MPGPADRSRRSARRWGVTTKWVLGVGGDVALADLERDDRVIGAVHDRHRHGGSGPAWGPGRSSRPPSTPGTRGRHRRRAPSRRPARGPPRARATTPISDRRLILPAARRARCPRRSGRRRAPGRRAGRPARKRGQGRLDIGDGRIRLCGDTPVLDGRGGPPVRSQCRAQRAGVGAVDARPPEAAVDEHEERPIFTGSSVADIGDLLRVGAVGDDRVSGRRGAGQDRSVLVHARQVAIIPSPRCARPRDDPGDEGPAADRRRPAVEGGRAGARLGLDDRRASWRGRRRRAAPWVRSAGQRPR